MPGISFLFKKPWHPQTLENQKKLFVAESRDLDRLRREEEAAAEVAREAELQRYEAAGDLRERDARTSSLRFMYCPPKKDEGETRVPPGLLPPSAKHGAETEDPAVKNFWKKMRGEKVEGSALEASTTSGGAAKLDDAGAASRSRGAPATCLERLVGKPAAQHTTREEMEARHPRLKNAPVEDAYVRNLDVKYKPFHDVVRNVRCIRCGTWGHSVGDRECPLAGELNPYDLARQRKEDPIQFSSSDEIIEEKQRLILKSASRSGLIGGPRAPSSPSAEGAGLVPENQQLVAWDSEGDSDPESEFLATLTTREKKLLLRKLKLIENSASSSPHRHSTSVPNPISSNSGSGGKRNPPRPKRRRREVQRNRSKSSSSHSSTTG